MHSRRIVFSVLLASFSLVPLSRAGQAPLPAEIENEQVLGIDKEPYARHLDALCRPRASVDR